MWFMGPTGKMTFTAPRLSDGLCMAAQGCLVWNKTKSLFNVAQVEGQEVVLQK